jgi:hypothetical protein
VYVVQTCIVIFMFGTARQLRMFELEQDPNRQAPRLPRRQRSQIGTVSSATIYIPSLSQYMGADSDNTKSEHGSPKLSHVAVQDSPSQDGNSLKMQPESYGIRIPANLDESEGYVNPWEAMELERTATSSSRTLSTRSA